MKTIAVMLLVMAGSFLYAQEAASQEMAYIREFFGTVEVRAPGTELWTPAVAGERISKDAGISTGFKSTALIVLGNSTLLVRPLTRLSLEEIQATQGNETVRLSLQTGRIRADVNPPLGGQTEFTVISPMVTASVRGTSFDFDGVNLKVDEGRVHVTGGDGSAVYVGAGYRSVSDPHTGKTAGAAEMARAELIPAMSAAITESTPDPSAIIPAAADRAFGFDW
jgi:hypothetical protein